MGEKHTPCLARALAQYRTVALLAAEINIGSGKGLDSIGFQGDQPRSAVGFRPQRERTGSRICNIPEMIGIKRR